jgi:transposase
MRAISTFAQIYICRRFVDFRKGVDGLSAIVEADLGLKPFGGGLFVFMSKRKNRVKILYWDKTGFALWYKRLETDKFAWPRGEPPQDVMVVTVEQLEWLLSGVDMWKMKTHLAVEFDKIG